MLSSFGALWLLVEIVAFFSPESADKIKAASWVFLVFGIGFALWLNRPIHEVKCHLVGRDIKLRICVDDFFKIPGAKIIGSNTTFDTDINSGIIDKSSIQGQFTENNYSSVSHLDADLREALAGKPTTPAPAGKRGKQDVFPIGTVALVRPSNKPHYLLAIAHINANGVARGSFDDLKTALPALWEYISNAGTIDALVIPILGSGFSRVPQKREEIVREILNSFIAACASSRFTNSLTVVIRPKDFYEHAVNLSELESYLQHVCRYTEFGANLRAGNNAGTAI